MAVPGLSCGMRDPYLWHAGAIWTSQVMLVVKNLLANAGNISHVGQEDPLEKEMATHPSNSCLGNSMGRGAWQAI